ncbi:histidine--tRNA ligase [Chloroflexota bacterium]
MLYSSLKPGAGGSRLYQAPRGTSDILPEEQKYWSYVKHKAAEICRLYGYERINTPIIEDAGLFTRGVGENTDIVEKEMYTFEDRGGNKLALIPEGTASICRAYVEHGMHNLPQPVRLYYTSPFFRYDRPQAGRYRQYYQVGFEAMGNNDPVLDAEIIDMVWQFYHSLGLRKLNLGLNSIGCRECRPEYLSALKKHYSEYTGELCSDCKIRLEKNPMRLLDCKRPSCQPVADSAPKSFDYLCPDCDEHFILLQKYISLIGIPFKVNHRMVRGLDYYTRTVYEVEPEKESGQSSLGGGGRYDDLIEELGGKPTPGVGFAAGIERIILNLKRQNIEVPPLESPRVFIAHMGEEAGEEAIKLASGLRQAGIGVLEATGGRSLKAQLRQANTLGVRHTVIIGDEEVKSGTVILRDMTTARQEAVSSDKLKELLK